MAKEKEQEQEQQAQQPAAEATATMSDGSPSGITAPVILSAKSREELDTRFQQLKAKHDGHTLTAGAIARSKETGEYSLRVDINP